MSYHSNMHSCRKSIIWTLTLINMIIWMNYSRFNWPTQNLVTSISNYFIDIHISLSTWTSLPDNQRKIVLTKFTINNFLSYLFNSVSYFPIQSVFSINFCNWLFNNSKCFNYLPRHFLSSNFKILKWSLSLGSPVFISWYFYWSKSILFYSRFFKWHLKCFIINHSS